MSKTKPKAEPKVTTYSVVPKRGGFQIMAYTIEDGKVTNVTEIGTEDVFVHMSNHLSRLIRKDLGL